MGKIIHCLVQTTWMTVDVLSAEDIQNKQIVEEFSMSYLRWLLVCAEGKWQDGTVGSCFNELTTAAVRCGHADRRSVLPVSASDEPEERWDGTEAECSEGNVRETTGGLDSSVTWQRSVCRCYGLSITFLNIPTLEWMNIALMCPRNNWRVACFSHLRKWSRVSNEQCKPAVGKCCLDYLSRTNKLHNKKILHVAKSSIL